MTSDPRHDLPTLLAEESFLRTLARALAADQADEVVQQTWLLALQHRGEIRAPRSWLGRIARNVAANLRRANRRRAAREREAAVPERAPSSAELMLREERRAALVRAVDQLPPPLREVVLLRWFEGLPPRRIAVVLGLPVATVWNRLRSALQQLRGQLDAAHEGDLRAWLLPLVGARLPRPAPVDLSTTPPVAAAGPMIVTGVLSMAIKTKLAVALGTVLVLAGAFLSWPAPGATVPVGPGPGAGPRSASAAVEPSYRSATTNPAPERFEARTSSAPVGADTGTLLVRARRASDGTAATGEGLVVLGEGEDELPTARRARTDDAGLARVDGLLPGTAKVRFLQSHKTETAVIAAGTVTELDFVIPVGIAVHGLVVDGRDQPIAGAEVDVVGISLPRPATIATSAADGTFEVRDLVLGSVLGARAAGFAASRMQLAMGTIGGVAEVRLQLADPGGVVEGLVTDPDGVPVRGAVVRVGDAEPPGILTSTGMPAVAVPVTTGADGRFRALGIAPGQQPVTVRAKGLPPWRGECLVSASATTSLGVVLAQGVTCTGIVRGDDGAPAVGATIVTGDRAAFTLVRTTVAADGTFTLAGLPPGPIELRVQDDQLGKATVSVHGEAGATVACQVMLSRGLELRGRVVDDDGKEVAAIYVSAADGQGWSDTVRADAAGRFAMANCPRGLLTVTARRGEQTVRSEDVAPSAGDITLRLPQKPVAVAPSVRIRGRVLGPDGRPVAGATVQARAPLGAPGGEAATAADGSFELGPMRPATYHVFLRATQFPWLQSERRELHANDVWDLGDLRLCDGGTARIEVSGATPGAEVQFDVRDQKGWVFPAQWLSDRQLCTQVLEPGDYEVLVRSAGTALQAFPFAVRANEETKVEAKLQRGVRQRFEFARADGVRVGDDLWHTLRCGKHELSGSKSVYWDHPPVRAVDGAMTAELWLAPGQYRLEVTGHGAAAEIGFEVGQGEGPALRLTLR